MTSKFHSRIFDEGTLTKLDIFKDYTREWLPVFLLKKQPIWTKINIIDFFAGPGTDHSGNPGSPILILNEVSSYVSSFKNSHLDIKLIFNDLDKSNYTNLKQIESNYKKLPCAIEIENLEFKIIFKKYYDLLSSNSSANLLFFDQCGISHITEKIFLDIIDLKHTDFLFFISSSTIKRFISTGITHKYVKLDYDEVSETPYSQIHRIILSYYRKLIPKDMEFYLSPFSLKKETGNIYGIIFGSGNLLGVEKFLKVCWNQDPIRGEANYDIDDENLDFLQLSIFEEDNKPKKLHFFEQELEKGILNNSIQTAQELYVHTITNGFLPKHAKEVLKKLEQLKIVHKQNLKLSYKALKEEAQLIEKRRDVKIQN